jgi:hypothetical protein
MVDVTTTVMCNQPVPLSLALCSRFLSPPPHHHYYHHHLKGVDALHTHIYTRNNRHTGDSLTSRKRENAVIFPPPPPPSVDSVSFYAENNFQKLRKKQFSALLVCLFVLLVCLVVKFDNNRWKTKKGGWETKQKTFNDSSIHYREQIQLFD